MVILWLCKPPGNQLLPGNRSHYKKYLSRNCTGCLDSTVLCGKLFDFKYKTPVSYGGVELYPVKIFIPVNDSGYFEDKVPAGTYKLSCKIVGYSNFESKEIKVKGNSRYSFDIYLGKFVQY